MNRRASCFFLLAALLWLGCSSAFAIRPQPLENRVGGCEQFASGQTSGAGWQAPENAMGLRVFAYKTVSGRLKWLNQDPIQEQGGINLYRFVGNDPVNKADFYGLAYGDWWDPRSYYNDGWLRDLYTGNPNASDELYDASLDAAADSVAKSSPVAQQELAVTSFFDPTGLSLGTLAFLGYFNPSDPHFPDSDELNRLAMMPCGMSRNAAFRQAKRENNIPMSQHPSRVQPNLDRRGKVQPGKRYEFDTSGGVKTIRDDAAGHIYPDDPTQNRGPHFNDDAGNHYDYDQ